VVLEGDQGVTRAVCSKQGSCMQLWDASDHSDNKNIAYCGFCCQLLGLKGFMPLLLHVITDAQGGYPGGVHQKDP
jgi:hypothetical protein